MGTDESRSLRSFRAVSSFSSHPRAGKAHSLHSYKVHLNSSFHDLLLARDHSMLRIGKKKRENPSAIEVKTRKNAPQAKQTQETAPRSKSRTIIRMLTTKLNPRSATGSGAGSNPSTKPPSRPPPPVNNAYSKEQRDAALRARGLLPPLRPNKDLSQQEKEQDARIPTVLPPPPDSSSLPSVAPPSNSPDAAALSAADLIKREWESKNRDAQQEERQRLSTFKFGGSSSNLVLPPSPTIHVELVDSSPAQKPDNLERPLEVSHLLTSEPVKAATPTTATTSPKQAQVDTVAPISSSSPPPGPLSPSDHVSPTHASASTSRPTSPLIQLDPSVEAYLLNLPPSPPTPHATRQTDPIDSSDRENVLDLSLPPLTPSTAAASITPTPTVALVPPRPSQVAEVLPFSSPSTPGPTTTTSLTLTRDLPGANPSTPSSPTRSFSPTGPRSHDHPARGSSLSGHRSSGSTSDPTIPSIAFALTPASPSPPPPASPPLGSASGPTTKKSHGRSDSVAKESTTSATSSNMDSVPSVSVSTTTATTSNTGGVPMTPVTSSSETSPIVHNSNTKTGSINTSLIPIPTPTTRGPLGAAPGKMGALSLTLRPADVDAKIPIIVENPADDDHHGNALESSSGSEGLEVNFGAGLALPLSMVVEEEAEGAGAGGGGGGAIEGLPVMMSSFAMAVDSLSEEPAPLSPSGDGRPKSPTSPTKVGGLFRKRGAPDSSHAGAGATGSEKKKSLNPFKRGNTIQHHSTANTAGPASPTTMAVDANVQNQNIPPVPQVSTPKSPSFLSVSTSLATGTGTSHGGHGGSSTAPRSPTKSTFSSMRRSVVGSLARPKSIFSTITSGSGAASSIHTSRTGTGAGDAASYVTSSTHRGGTSPTYFPVSRKSMSPSRLGQQQQGPPPTPRRAVSPVLHSHGSILMETAGIEDEETRRRTEMAFLG